MSDISESFYMDEETKKKYVRVTTVTGCAAKPALYGFYGKHGTKKANEIKDESTQIGTSVHTYIESLFRGDKQAQVVQKGAKVRRAIANFHKFQEKARLVPATLPNGKPALELTVFSKTYGYAGTIDGLFINKKPFDYYDKHSRKKTLSSVPAGTLLLTDWKTSSAIFEEVYMQEGAYGAALTELVDDGILSIEDGKGNVVDVDESVGLVVRLDKQNNFKPESDIKVVSQEDLHKAFGGFLGLLNYYQWKTNRRNK